MSVGEDRILAVDFARPTSILVGAVSEILLEWVELPPVPELITELAFETVDNRRDNSFDRFTILSPGTGGGGFGRVGYFEVLGVDKTVGSCSLRENVFEMSKDFASSFGLGRGRKSASGKGQ